MKSVLRRFIRRFKTPTMDESILLHCPKCGGVHWPAEDRQFDALLVVAWEQHRPSREAIFERFPILVETTKWQLEEDPAQIVWTTENGARAIASFHPVAVWDEGTEDFVWSWHSFECNAAEMKAATNARAYGKAHGHDILTFARLKTTEQQAWWLTYLTAYLAELPGAYRLPRGDRNWLFLALGEPAWVGDQ